jgi:serine/threonine-protein kinase
MIGTTVGAYRIVSELGAGGMGVVYKALDLRLQRHVALKALPPTQATTSERRQRFLQEARAASALNDAHIVTIHDILEHDGHEFLVMELVEGRTLHDLAHQGLGREQVLEYARQIAAAVGVAHAAGIVHRDLKPGNVMVTDKGAVKVLDFGIAKMTARDTDVTMAQVTQPGDIMGTAAYMAPEQALGGNVDHRADIYSLGAILHELLGKNGAPVPRKLNTVITKALARDPNQRFASMQEFAAAIDAAAGRSWTASRTAAVAAVVLSVALIVWLMFAADVLPARSGTGTESASSLPQQPAAVTGPTGSFNADTATPYDLYREARALLDRFDREANPSRAIALLERAVEKDNTFALGYATLTEAYRHRHRVAPDEQWRKLMKQSAERAMKLDPELGAAHTAMGLQLMEEVGKTSEAEAAFQRAIDLDPRNVAPHLWLAVLLSNTRQPERARASLERGLQLDPNNWAALQELGLVHYRAAEYAAAAAAFERARSSSPDNVRVLANLAAAYHMLDRYDDAASTLQRAIEIEPAARHYTNLGTLRFFQGRYEDAIPPLEKAVELAPNRYLYWGNLADAYRWSPGHKSKARDTYARGIELLREQLAARPDDPDMRSTLALYLAKAGDTAGAVEHLRAFEQRPPSQAAVLFRLAVAYELASQRERALAVLEGALRAGYAEREVRGEPELINLRNDVRYHRLLASVRPATKR